MENKKEQPLSFTKKISIIGIFGGLFWGGIWYFVHIFSFTVAGPNYMILPFAFGEWKHGFWGNLLSIVLMAILSIPVAIIYGALFKKFQGIFPGIIYGALLWAILFFAVGSISPVLENAMELPRATVVTTLCIFILYGVFITYSVSFEAAEENRIKSTARTAYSNKS